MPISNQLMLARAGTYNFSRKTLKLKFFSSKENNFCTVHCLPKIMAYLVLMLHYFLPTCLVIYVSKKLLFLHADAVYIEKSCNVLLFINDYFCNLPFVVLLLLRLGDVETNPGLKKSSVIKFCHWDLNGLAGHDFLKVSLIEAFITTHNFDIICLSETFLDSTVPQDDENIMIIDYSLLRADHPSNSTRGGVCLYLKKHLLLIRRKDLSILQKCLATEIIVDNEKYFFTCLYRSLNQNHEGLENFSSNLDLLLSNINDNHPTCSILMGDFNAKCSKWYNSDKNNRVGIKLDNITTRAGYSQSINESTHFVNKTSSCQKQPFADNLQNKCFLKISQISQETTLEYPFNKVAGLRPATLLKRDSNKGVFL